MSYSNDPNRVLQSDSKLFADSGPRKSAIKSGKVSRKLRFCLRFAAFVFSHVGLGFLVLVYTVLGAFIFRHFEESTLSHSITHIADIRNSTVNKLWTETYKLNVLYKENWTAMAIKEIEQFQRVLVKALKEGYTPGEENKAHSRWSLTHSWMYAISLITTIGSTNRPSTSEGKIATILYALLGIPIMLLFLSTIGNLLGQGLKSLYTFCCGCSNESHRSLVNVHGHEHEHHHHHHLHEDYQVHHIPLTSLNGTAHLVACEPSNHKYPVNNVPVLNTPFHPRCSYEPDFAELEAETKLCADSVDHLCADNGLHSAVTHPHCKYLATGLESFFKEEPTKGSFCQSSPGSGYEEPSCETVPFLFLLFLISLYFLVGVWAFYVCEGWSLLDGAFFTFMTLSTIGYGDIIPEKTLSSNQTESKKRIILIVLYIYVLSGMPIMLLFLSKISNLLGQWLNSLYTFCCGCSNESHRSLVNL